MVREKVKTELIEELAAHHMETSNLPPLASKIFAFLLVNYCRDGYNFDELVDVFKVSKSSVSNSLNLLIQYNFIIQTNRIDERKRRYKITPDYLSIRLNKIIKDLIRERQLSVKLLEFHQTEVNPPGPGEISKAEVYLNHLDTAIHNLSCTLERIDNITNANQLV